MQLFLFFVVASVAVFAVAVLTVSSVFAVVAVVDNVAVSHSVAAIRCSVFSCLMMFVLGGY